MEHGRGYRKWQWTCHCLMVSSFFSVVTSKAATAVEQSFANEPSPQTAVIGSTVVLPCRVINKLGELQWTRDDFGLGNERELLAFKRYQMIGSDEEGDYSLRISPVTLEDDAHFQCQVTGSGITPGVRSQTAKLTVYVPPEPPEILQGSSIIVTEGEVVQIECTSNGGKPAAEMQWLDGSGRVVTGDIVYTAEITTDRRLSNARSTLNLPVSREHHNAVFTCAASNPALRRPLKAQIQLKVRYAPQVTIQHDRSGYRDGQSAILTCAAEANPNNLNYRWYKEGQLIADNNSTELTVLNITRESSLEDITCEVSNEVGTTKEVTRINIYYEPKFLTVPVDQYAGLGENVTLQCLVDASPEPVIVWIKDGRVVGEGPELVVLVNRNNAGAYQCVGQVDGFADISAIARIFLKGPPRVISERHQWGNQGETVLVECIVAEAPAPSLSVTWTHHGKLVDLDKPRFEEVQDVNTKGVRHTLVIRDARVTDFGPYKCSVHNEYGSDVSEIILDKQKTLPLLLLVCGVTGGVMLVLVVAMVAIMCAKKNASRHKGGKSYSSPEKSITIQTTDQNSSANESDLKVEFDQRTGSSMSNKEGELDAWEPEGDNPSTPQYLTSTNPYIYPDTFTAVPVNRKERVGSNGGLAYDNHLLSPSPVQHHTPSPTRGFLSDTTAFSNMMNGVGPLGNGVAHLGNGVGTLSNGVGTLSNGMGHLGTGVGPLGTSCQHYNTDVSYPMYGDYETGHDMPDGNRHFTTGFSNTLGDYNYRHNGIDTLPLSHPPTSKNSCSLSNTFSATVPRLGIPVDPNRYIMSPKTQVLQGTLATHV